MIFKLNMQQTGRSSATERGVSVAVGPESAPNMPVQQAPHHELTVLATVAHELRGPLTALATSSELLAEDFLHLDPEQVKSMLGAMHRRTIWLQGLVENLLCAATIREGRLQLYPQTLSLLDVIGDVQTIVGPLLEQRGQRLRLRVAPRLPDVSADGRRGGGARFWFWLPTVGRVAPTKSHLSLVSLKQSTIGIQRSAGRSTTSKDTTKRIRKHARGRIRVAGDKQLKADIAEG